MNNNDIFKKLRVALKLRDDEIVEILKLVDFKITKSELGAIFRAEDHPNFRPCGDQLLRNFLNGLIIHKRGKMPKKGEAKKKNDKVKRTNSHPARKNKPKIEDDGLIKSYTPTPRKRPKKD